MRHPPPTLPAVADTSVFFNPSCSKCRTAQGILHDRGVDAEYIRYLDQAPTLDELRRLMSLLDIDDPRAMMRRGEPIYDELGLDDAGPHELLRAITEHPILLERPIVVRGNRAVIARPPERVLDLLQ